MDLRAINSIIAAVLTAFIGIFPLLRRWNRLSILFACSNLSLALWNLGDVVVLLPQTDSIRLLLFRLNYIAGVFVVLFFYLFMFEFVKRPITLFPRTWTTLKIVGLSLIGLSFTPLLVHELDTSVSPFKEIPGPAMPLFIIFLVGGCGFALSQVFKAYASAKKSV